MPTTPSAPRPAPSVSRGRPVARDVLYRLTAFSLTRWNTPEDRPRDWPGSFAGRSGPRGRPRAGPVGAPVWRRAVCTGPHHCGAGIRSSCLATSPAWGSQPCRKPRRPPKCGMFSSPSQVFAHRGSSTASSCLVGNRGRCSGSMPGWSFSLTSIRASRGSAMPPTRGG